MVKFGENVEIGDNHRIGEYVVLGHVPPGKSFDKLIIGRDATIRSHTVIYGGNRIGDRFQTGHGAMVRENNIIGDDVSIGTHSIVEKENRIGNRVRIHSRCFIPEFITIEDKAWIGPGVTVLNVLHPPCPKFEECAQGTVIGRNAKIGGNVTLGPRVKIGENALIGAGSVVLKDVPADTVVAGNPARVLKKVEEMGCVLGYYDHPYVWEDRE